MFPGFDGSHYRGDHHMQRVWNHTNLRFVAFYLSHHPARDGTPPERNVTTWTEPQPSRSRTTWQFLRDEGWGLVPVYVGRQIPWLNGKTEAVATAVGTRDADESVAHARRVGVEAGAALYLDLEAGGFLDPRHPQRGAYLGSWFARVRDQGFRAGVYCSHVDVTAITKAFPGVVVWFFRVPRQAPSPFDNATGTLTTPPAARWPDAPQGFHGQATAWQFDQLHGGDNPRKLPGGAVLDGVTIAPGVPGEEFRFSPIDFNSARVIDPSHPENRGAVAVCADAPGGMALACRIDAALGTWTQRTAAGTWDAPTLELLGPGDVGAGEGPFDPNGLAAASRTPGQIDVFGAAMDGTIWTGWRNAAESFPQHTWTLNPTVPARKNTPVAAVSRAPDQLDVFFINRRHEVCTTWWNPGDRDWAGHTMPISHGVAVAPGSNLEVLTSTTTPERLDLFYVDWNESAHWMSWAWPGPWHDEIIPRLPNVSGQAGIAARMHGGTLHVVALGTDGGLRHVHRGNLKTGDPAAWSAAAAVPLPGSARPAALRLAEAGGLMIAVVLRTNGTLSWTAWNGTAWLGSGTDAGRYSSAGRLALLAHGRAVDVFALDKDGNAVTRRLEINPGDPGRPIVPTGAVGRVSI